MRTRNKQYITCWKFVGGLFDTNREWYHCIDLLNNHRLITSAAILCSDGVLRIDRDHARIIQHAPKGTCKAGSISGFRTDRGFFVDRINAKCIAKAANQVNDTSDRGLFSEEIWSYYPGELFSGTGRWVWSENDNQYIHVLAPDESDVMKYSCQCGRIHMKDVEYDEMGQVKMWCNYCKCFADIKLRRYTQS